MSLGSLNETSLDTRTTTLIVGYEMWTWLLLVSIAFFSVAFIIVVYLQNNQRCCYNHQTNEVSGFGVCVCVRA